MNKETLAELLNGRSYRHEIDQEMQKSAKENGLIAIFGYSDDIAVLEGAIEEEIDAYNGAHFIIATPGWNIPLDEDGDTFRKARELEAVPIEEESRIQKNRFEAVWSPDYLGCPWLIKTDLPHSTFDIFADGELYCRGVVIDVKDLH